MKITLDLRSVAVGGLLAIVLGTLAAAQLPQFQATNGGNGYLGLMNPGRELWRWNPDDQIANGPYTIPAGKELIVCGVGVRSLPQLSNGGYPSSSAEIHLVVDGERLLNAYVGAYTSFNSAQSYFPGLLVDEAQTLEFAPRSNSNVDPHVFVYGYLRNK
jgi:hypothetical protein